MLRSNTVRRVRALVSLPLLLAIALLTGCRAGGPAAEAPAGPWGGARLVQPAELAAQLADSAAAKPLLLHVGVAALYRQGAIPNSRYVGPASEARGIDAMLAAVKDEPKDRDIVIYCGCCPAVHCPNMKAAFAAMREAGFTNVKALWIEQDFERDWASHGYPTEKPAS
ncbi:MAG: rhodanese-like domain-containing protein [Candidatus Eisenbacteria bacterium]|nr:rhodanese-like domain-containing protein [Candidatus Eisenbacteria bacterium]